MSTEIKADACLEWMDNDTWWVFGASPLMAERMARFHQRNRFHLRMAMSHFPELEDPAYWEGELARRQSAMLAGQAVHLVGVPRGIEGWDASGDIGGLLSFWSIEHGDFDACTMSILLDRRLEGRGMMYAMAAPAMREVLARYKLHRIMASHLPENLRSARVLRRLGFTVEGYARDFIRINGRWRDNVLLSVVAE